MSGCLCAGSSFQEDRAVHLPGRGHHTWHHHGSCRRCRITDHQGHTAQLTVHWWPSSTVQPTTDPYELCTLWNHLASNCLCTLPNRLADSQKSRIGALPADLLRCPPLTSRVHHATFSRVGFTVCAPLSLLPWSSLSTAFTRFAVFILIRLLLLLVLSLKPSGFKVPGAKK